MGESGIYYQNELLSTLPHLLFLIICQSYGGYDQRKVVLVFQFC